MLDYLKNKGLFKVQLAVIKTAPIKKHLNCNKKVGCCRNCDANVLLEQLCGQGELDKIERRS